MIKKVINNPTYISNYFLANNSKYWDWFLWSYWGAWFYYECEKKHIVGSMFYFLVSEYKNEIRYLTRIAVKLKDIKDIKALNELITLWNQRYFFETLNNPNSLHSTITLNWYSLPILNKEDVEKIQSTNQFEIYQVNLNLLMGFYNEPMAILDLNLPKMIFVNELIMSYTYINTCRKIFAPAKASLKTTTKLYKTLARLDELEYLLLQDFNYFNLSLKNNTSDFYINKSIYYSIDNEDFLKELSFAYFQKISSYYDYLTDFSKFTEEKNQKKIHDTIFSLSDKWIDNTQWFNAMLEYAEKHISDSAMKQFTLLKENLAWASIMTMEEFYWVERNEEGKLPKLVYPHNLFKPNYWYDGLADFLFDKAATSPYRWDDEKETRVKPFFEKWRHFKNWNQDDIILRYITFRWLLERMLQNHPTFKEYDASTPEGKEKATEFMNLWVKVPKKYEQLFIDVEKQIQEHTLDLNVFKWELLNYLDDDQKAFVDKYADVEMKYQTSLPRWEKIVIDWKVKRKELTNEEKTPFAIHFREYILQIEYELFTIAYLDFAGYFNITFDYILFGKLHNIAVWPWRWSAAGSLVSYLTYITDLDPLEYGLLFERMLHILKDKYDVPDVDSDFSPIQRYELIEYVKNKFGEDNVAHVWAYQSSSIKGMIKDLTRWWVIPFENINMITKALGSKAEEIEQNFQSMLDFYKWRDVNLSWDVTHILGKWRNQLKPILEIAKTLTWYPKIPSINACWVIISPVPIETLSPCRFLPNNQAKIGYFDKNEMEHWGLLKYDFLWLNNMQIIKTTIQSILWAEKSIREKYWIKLADDPKDRKTEEWDNLDWYKMYYDIIANIWKDDEDVYEQVFQMWNTTWVFQFESEGMRKSLKLIKPDCITELGDLNAMFRPWPIEYIPNYAKIKHEWETFNIYSEEFLQNMSSKYWKEEVYRNVAFFEDIWNKVTVNTKGILVYQEQLMSFFYYLGHSYTDADFIRKIFSKIKGWKKSFKDLEKYYDKTMIILDEHNIKKEFFDFIYKEIFVDWASYWFNKSHSACYSVIAYITGWLKTKYPYHYYSVILRWFESQPSLTAKVINEMNILGIDIVWPDLFESFKHAVLKQKN